MKTSLINKGIFIVGEQSYAQSNVIIVVGTARGGTSMVAGSMAKLGIFMGDQAAPPVYEDVKLSRCFEKREFDAVGSMVQEYSRRHTVWGWKRPSSVNYLDDVHRLMRGRYVFVYKDIFSVALRNSISMLSELLPDLNRALNDYHKTIDFLGKEQVYAMMVSFDKALLYPEEFIKALAKFCGVQADEKQIGEAAAFIRPNPEDYLDATRITKATGRLDGFRDGCIYGWAMFVHSNKPAAVDLFVNEKKIGTVVADQSRPDLMEKFNRSCAFSFYLPDGVHLNSGDIIRARVVNEIEDLNNSPFTV